MSMFASRVAPLALDTDMDGDEEIGAFEVDDEPTLRTNVPLPLDPRSGRQQLLRQAAIGALAASLMHDLASLLQAMEGALEEVADLVGPGGPPGLREATTDAISAGREAEGLFMSMRRFLRDGEVISRPVSVDRLVQRAVTQADTQLRRVVLRMSEMPAAQVVACEPLAVQVLVQLLKNAVQSSPSGARVDVQVEVDGDKVAFHVIDDGSGAPPEVVDHLDAPWTLGEYPSAFGLAVAAFVAQSHSGALTYQPEPGRGGRFTATLPRA
jgi:signal transduction histidine kinase